MMVGGVVHCFWPQACRGPDGKLFENMYCMVEITKKMFYSNGMVLVFACILNLNLKNIYQKHQQKPAKTPALYWLYQRFWSARVLLNLLAMLAMLFFGSSFPIQNSQFWFTFSSVGGIFHFSICTFSFSSHLNLPAFNRY